MFSNNNAHFGAEIVTVSVGPDEEGFAVHKNVLTAVVGDGVLPADLPNEQPKTIQALVRWIYSAYLYGLYLPRDSLDYDLDLLFELYAFAHAYLVTRLQDDIVSVIYAKFANNSNNLWFTLGSEKIALETLVRVVPPEYHLYRLVIQSLAYSMHLRPVDQWFQESDVEKVMDTVPGELWGATFKEMLLIKTLEGWRQDFDSIIGSEIKFLKQYEGLGGGGPFASLGNP